MPQPKKAKKNVLVVEDDRGIQTTIRHLLESEGFTVFVADHGRDGLDLLRQMEPPCVVLLDIQMPEMDGYEFLREKNADPSIATIPVVVVSATADEKLLVGATELVRKPFEIPALLEAVERHCS